MNRSPRSRQTLLPPISSPCLQSLKSRRNHTQMATQANGKASTAVTTAAERGFKAASGLGDPPQGAPRIHRLHNHKPLCEPLLTPPPFPQPLLHLPDRPSSVAIPSNLLGHTNPTSGFPTHESEKAHPSPSHSDKSSF
jgi:hypothetical protein